MSQRSSQKAESRGAIVASAAKLVRKCGAQGMSVQDAMAGAGLTVGAFYAHFADKDALLAEAFELAMADAHALVAGSAQGKTGAVAGTAVVARYLSEAHRDDVQMGCPLPAMLGEAASESSLATRKLLASGVETLRRRIANATGDAVDDETALALVALLVGGQIVARAVRGTAISSETLGACQRAGESLLRSGKARKVKRA